MCWSAGHREGALSVDRRTVLEKLFINTRDDSDIARASHFGVEIVDYLAPGSLDEEETKLRVDEKLRGIDRRILHGPLEDQIPLKDDAPTRSATLEHLRHAFELAIHHHAPRVVFHSGFDPQNCKAQRWLRDSVLFWKEYMDGKPPGFSICIENVCDDEPEPLAELVDRTGDCRISLCLDIGHASINSARPLRDWVETLGPRIGHVHLHNNDGEVDRHWPPARGIIRVAETLDLLLQHASLATYTLECDAAASLSWLNDYCGLRGRLDR